MDLAWAVLVSIDRSEPELCPIVATGPNHAHCSRTLGRMEKSFRLQAGPKSVMTIKKLTENG
ncbi:MAG: hypothetical protein EA377_07270 [Phycisphaerales bacterium]|nr:MAG: hypothetical protein EA377_07270 [Phycisphaerales bacterium]